MSSINLYDGTGEKSYEDIREAMDGESFTMSIVSEDEARAVIEAVNQGIDSHLEACFVPDRGDRYERAERKVGDIVHTVALDCDVSIESLPVLLRRLLESGDEAGETLARDILSVLGFETY